MRAAAAQNGLMASPTPSSALVRIGSAQLPRPTDSSGAYSRRQRCSKTRPSRVSAYAHYTFYTFWESSKVVLSDLVWIEKLRSKSDRRAEYLRGLDKKMWRLLREQNGYTLQMFRLCGVMKRCPESCPLSHFFTAKQLNAH